MFRYTTYKVLGVIWSVLCCLPAWANTTVIIHGTLFPILSRVMYNMYAPPALTHADTQEQGGLLGDCARALARVQPSTYPLASSYLWGWSGALSFKLRESEAEKLYSELKRLTGPITLIAHSHGGNLALNLARVAAKHGDKTFCIDTLILLACPVQGATCTYISSPTFKRVYALYSAGDIVQTLDPQLLYAHNRKRALARVPLFSGRLFSPSSNLIQARILVDGNDPGHMYFMKPCFIEQMPSLLAQLDKSSHKLGAVVPLTYNIVTKGHCRAALAA